MSGHHFFGGLFQMAHLYRRVFSNENIYLNSSPTGGT